MNRRRPPAQAVLFGPIAQPHRGREAPKIYAAIGKLRARGFVVFACGRGSHSVGGKILSSKQLLLLASVYGD